MAYTTNIIPAMTSATAPSGMASANSEYPVAEYAAWKAFNHINDDMYSWISAPPELSGWLQYQFPTTHVITRYAVTSRNYADDPEPPKSWMFHGSNDGTTWATLDTQTDITDWATSANVRKVFDVTNSTAYAYYRLDVSATNGANFVAVGELEMMETVVTYVPRSIGSGIGSGIASGIA